MGAERVVVATNAATVPLHGFADTELVKLTLRGGRWLLLGRVVLANIDGDWQSMTAKILHQANVVIDDVSLWVENADRYCVALQGTLEGEDLETVTLECNTYNGQASFASLSALTVDAVEIQ